jgi:integrase
MYNEVSVVADKLSINANPTAKYIIEHFKRKENHSSNWLEFFEKLENRYFELNKIRYAIRMKVVRRKLASFFNEVDRDLREADENLLKDFEAYLYKLGNQANTAAANVSILKRVYKQAIDDGVVDRPNLRFMGYQVKTESVERDKLTREEITVLEKLTLPEGSILWHTKNYFLFSFYLAGIRFADVVQMRWKNVTEGYLRYIMDKTKKVQSLKLHKEAKMILDFYAHPDKKREDFIFPILKSNYDTLSALEQANLISSKNAIVNRNLKLLAAKMEISKKLTFHVARHSFAYIAFKVTKDSLAVQRALQHSELKETQEYITSLANDSERDILGEIFN